MKILILPIHEHCIYLYLFLSFSVYFLNVLWFSEYRSFMSLIKFITMYFILFDAVVTGIVFTFLFLIVCCQCIEKQQISFFKKFICYFWLCWVFIAAYRLSVVAASGSYSLLQCVARGLSSCGSQAVEHRLSRCGSWAQLLRGMWDLPGPGIEPVSPALAGGFSTTAPPGKPSNRFLYINF